MTDGNKDSRGTVAELRALLDEHAEDTDWRADEFGDVTKTCGVWTQDGDGVCKTWGNAAHGATSNGRARLIAALRNAAPDLLRVVEAARVLRLQCKPPSMSEAEFWKNPQLNTGGAGEALEALHRALVALDEVNR